MRSILGIAMFALVATPGFASNDWAKQGFAENAEGDVRASMSSIRFEKPKPVCEAIQQAQENLNGIFVNNEYYCHDDSDCAIGNIGGWCGEGIYTKAQIAAYGLFKESIEYKNLQFKWNQENCQFVPLRVGLCAPTPQKFACKESRCQADWGAPSIPGPSIPDFFVTLPAVEDSSEDE